MRRIEWKAGHCWLFLYISHDACPIPLNVHSETTTLHCVRSLIESCYSINRLSSTVLFIAIFWKFIRLIELWQPCLVIGGQVLELLNKFENQSESVCVWVRYVSVKSLLTEKHLHRVQGFEALSVVRFGVTDEHSQRDEGLLRFGQGLRRRRPTFWPGPHTSTTNWLALVHPWHDLSTLFVCFSFGCCNHDLNEINHRNGNGNNWKKSAWHEEGLRELEALLPSWQMMAVVAAVCIHCQSFKLKQVERAGP